MAANQDKLIFDGDLDAEFIQQLVDRVNALETKLGGLTMTLPGGKTVRVVDAKENSVIDASKATQPLQLNLSGTITTKGVVMG